MAGGWPETAIRKLVLPQQFRDQVLQSAHGHPWSVHQGHKTLDSNKKIFLAWGV